MVLVEFLYEILSIDLNFKKIIDVFERDVNLFYKLLCYLNFVVFKCCVEISIIK